MIMFLLLTLYIFRSFAANEGIWDLLVSRVRLKLLQGRSRFL